MECSNCKNQQMAGEFCFICGYRLQIDSTTTQPVGNIYCRHCRQQIPSDPTHTFCMHCGKVLAKTAFQEFENFYWAVNLVLLVVVFLTYHSELACIVSFVGFVWFFGVPYQLRKLEIERQNERGKIK